MDAAKWSHSQPQAFQDFGLVKPMEEMVSNNICSRGQMLEKKTKPPEQLNCPRCKSTNTKFCYYNNYSLTQPRYLCKSCRRYWTEGGSLRNVPVGGGSRKNRSLISNPKQHHGGQPSHGLSQYPQGGKVENNNGQQIRYTSSFVQAPAAAPDLITTAYSNGFSMQDYKPNLGFSIDGGIHGGRVFFPFGTGSSTNGVDQNKEQQGNSAGYWTNGAPPPW